MFDTLSEAIAWAKRNYPGCSFSARLQKDGPTILSIKHKGTNEIRSVVYVRRQKRDDNH